MKGAFFVAKKKPSVKMNLLYNMLYQVLVMIMPLITAPYIARVLGADGVGIFSYSRSIAQYFLLFAMLGVNNYGCRSIAQVKDLGQEVIDQKFSSIYYFQLITSSASVIVYIVYLLFIVKENRFVAVIQLVYILSAATDINWLFFGMEEFKISVTSKTAIKILNIILILTLVKTKQDVALYTFIMCVGYFIGQSYLWLYIKRYAHFVRVPFSDIISHFRETLILFIPIIATSIYRVMDKIMIGEMSNLSQVGYYENSEKLINICLTVVSALGTVMLPKMSNLNVTNQAEGRKYMEKSMQMALFLGCAIAFGVASVAKEFIPIFYGPGFTPSILITQGLTITVIFISWACVIRVLYLIPKGENKIYVSSVCIGAVINVIINAILIKRFGAFGAVWGTIAAEVFVAVYQTYMVRKKLDIKKFISDSSIFFCAGLIMAICVRVTANILELKSIYKLLLEISIGGIVYLTISFVYFVKSENEVFMGLLNKGRKLVGLRG